MRIIQLGPHLSVILAAMFWCSRSRTATFFILNNDTPTRLPPNGNPTSPDLSLISVHLALSLSWSTNVSLDSDHLPISISFNDDVPPPRTASTYTNFKRAKWGLWTSETESLFRNATQPASCSQGVKSFQNVLLKASKHHIPSGFRKDFRSGVPRAAVSLTEERDRRRSIDPHDPELPRLNLEISEMVRCENRKVWQESVQSSKHRASLDK
jgi:hypothetical protein